MQNKLKKEISSFGLLFISVAAIFGSGWLFTPLYAAQIAGPYSIIAWLIGAIISVVVGITMSEVITLFPKAGGLNTVIQMTHGKLIGMIANILTLVVCIILPALEVRAILQYLGSHNLSIMTIDHQITLLGYIIAGALLLLINCLNLYGAKLFSRINSISVIFKLIAPITICLLFLFTLFKNGSLNHFNFYSAAPFKWEEIFLAISTSGIIFSFNGFNQATLFAAESKNPSKAIPFAILGSILFTTLLYIFIQYVFIISLPKSSFLQGWNMLSFSGDNGPFAGLATILGLHTLLYFIYADAIISPLGTAFSYSSGAPRMFYAFAKTSKIFPALHKLNNRGIPIYSVFLSMVLGFLAFISLPSLKSMISILVAAFVLNYTLAPISLLSLRKHYPYERRPFTVPYAPLFCYLSLFLSHLMVLCCGYDSLKHLLIIVMTVYIFGNVFIFRTIKDLKFEIKSSFWFILQAIFLCALSCLRENNILTFYQIFLMMCVFTFMLFKFASLDKKIM